MSGTTVAVFEQIYQAEVPYVWNCLRRFGIPERDLEDKVHDVFVVLYRRWTDYDSTRPIRPWLAGIAVRVASSHHRRPEQKKLILEEREAQDDQPAQDEIVAETEARELVLQALDYLEQDRRVVFVLHELQGHSIPEIADILDVPLNTLYSRLRLAREQFSKTIRQLHLIGGGR